MIKKTVFALTLVAALVVPTQSQAQVTGTYTVSGSSGSWFINFMFTNGVATSPYGLSWIFGFSADIVTPTGAPTGYALNDCLGNFWATDPCSPTGAEAYGIAPGDSLSGFLGTSSRETIPDTIDFDYWIWDGNEDARRSCHPRYAGHRLGPGAGLDDASGDRYVGSGRHPSSQKKPEVGGP